MNRMMLNLDRRTVHSYEIHLGTDILDRMAMLIAMNRWASRYVLVTDENVAALHGEQVEAALKKAGLAVERITVPAGEAAKGIQTVLSLTERLTALGADRQTALIALGGGVVGDLTGFAAAIYMRGIPVIQIPTTLLAQVDSGIGGKTGVDTAAGKNLLGAFHQPRAVFIDCAFLQTLPDEQIRSGLAEAIKYGAIEAPELLEQILAAAAAGKLRDPAFLEGIVAAACRIKKGFVELDEQDRGVRRMLNFGHTVGHAIEAASDYALSHGEAVAVGMVAAADLSRRFHGLPAGENERLSAAIRAVGLPDRIPAGMPLDDILARLQKDKKKEGAKVNFVLLKKLGVPFVNGGIQPAAVRETLEGMTR
jgi:3-dehydroquinate synthase